MLVLGISGGIGSGKSYVCSKLKAKGAHIFDCDSEAKKIMVKDPEVIAKIKKEFGAKSYTKKKLNRKHLADIVFSDKKRLRALEKIVHPKVLEKIFKEKRKKHKVLVIEMATLFENGWDKYVDKSIWVDANIMIRKQRVMERDDITFSQFMKRIQNQDNGEENIKKADIVVVNEEKLNLRKLYKIMSS